MDTDKDYKRKRDKRDDDEYRKEKKSKKPRSRSRSPAEGRERDSRRKRRRSRSQSPRIANKQDKRDDPPKDFEVKKEAPQRKVKEADMLNTRTGGAYIPPARLRMMQAQITDKSSVAYQRLAWEALKKSIHGHINKINIGNIGIIIKELLKENIVRGRGLLCRSVIQAQAASPTFTNVYAALVAAVNSRFPNIGELLLKRLVIQFKRGFKRNDKPTCISSASFVAHLVNQRVAHEILALELLTLLVETPTDDSVEVAIAFLKECGQKLTEVSSKGVNAIFEMLRNILHEGQLDKRVQYMIEVMFQVWKDGFKDHPALIEELELVPEEEQFTHLLMLDDATDSQDILNVFKFDEKYEENEQKYKTLSKEILGSDVESGDEDGSEGSGSEESEDEEAETVQKEMTIIDNTETNLIALRRTIYLTINSSLDFEECAHKLMKMQLKPGQEVELCHMFLDCCAEQRTYEKFYGLLAQRFCNINRIYIGPFEEIFKDSYSTAHRLDTNRLRNVSKFFAHLLFTDSISWEVLECVKLNEEDTTSSSRIYIKILFQELAEYMGLKKLNDRLKDPTLQEAFGGVFPRDNPKNTRFSINFFTSIGLGGLTDELREHLKQMPKNVPPPITEITVDSDSDSSSSSSSSESSSSSDDSSSNDSSDSEEESSKKKKKSDKSKKDNSKKNQSPKTPQEEPDKSKDTERWGHDGFYDTYGKDARRTEFRPTESRPDREYSVRSRDVPRKNNDHRDKGYEQRNGDDSRRYWDNRRNDQGERNEHRRGGEENNDRRRDRTDDYSRNKRDDDRDRHRDNNDDSKSNKRVIEEDNRDNRKREKVNQKEQDYRDRNHDSRSNRREIEENDRDNRRRDKGNQKEQDHRDRNDGSKSNRREIEEEDRDNRKRDKVNQKERDYRERNDDSKPNKREIDNKGRDDRTCDNKQRKEYDDKSYIEDDKRKRKQEKDNRKLDKDDYRKETNDNRRSKSGKNKKTEDSDSSSDQEVRSNKKKDKQKSKDDKYVSSSESLEESQDQDDTKKYKSSDEEEDSKSKRRNKDKKRNKDKSQKSKKTKKKSEKSNDKDGWDIRGSSVRREIPVNYWNSHDTENAKKTRDEWTPERVTKKDKRKDR